MEEFTQIFADRPSQKSSLEPDEFWNAWLKAAQGELTPSELQRYKTVGIFAEAQARDRGTSLLPYCWQDPSTPPSQLSDELLIAIGLVSLVMQGIEEE